MASHRIVRAEPPRCCGDQLLPRCRSEGTLVDVSDSHCRAREPCPSGSWSDNTAAQEAVQEVVAIKDYVPSSFTTLKFSKGDHLFVLDTSGGEWWYAHNHREMGYIPAAYVRPLSFRNSSFSDSGMVDGLGDGDEECTSSSLSINPFMDVTSRSSPDNARQPKPMAHGDDSFSPSRRSHSLSQLSVLQAQARPTVLSSGFATGLSAPSPEQFQSREDFRTAWLNHRKLARSCHALESLGQSPGWGQTQPVETSTVCRLDSNGGVVQLPDTDISVHVPEGHVVPGDHQQISIRALLDPPLELNGDHCSSISPVVELQLSNMEVKSSITLEMKVCVHVKEGSLHDAQVLCVRSGSKEGPYVPTLKAYVYKDAVQVHLDCLEPRMYVAAVVKSQHVARSTTVWDYVQRKVTLGLYGPKHVHPTFRAALAIFGHDCAPKSLLVNEVGGQTVTVMPVSFQLWGKHQFALQYPQDLQVGLYSNMSSYRVEAGEGGGVIRGFQVKLGKVSQLLYTITALDPDNVSDFTLRVQVKDDLGCILTQFCVQTPTAPPKGAAATLGGQRRFLKRKEVDKIVLSPLAVTSKYPKFQDRCVTGLRFGKVLKTVSRQHKSPYLLEYRKGEVLALLSEDKIRLRGQLRTKEWFIGYCRGKTGLVHAKNVLVLGKVKPVGWCGPDLSTTALLQQILKPCKFLTYIYATVRTVLMENVSNWRTFADALGYGSRPLSYFCRTQPENEAEKVASVLEKLKEECTSTDSPDRKSFQRELMMALLKMDCQGLVARLVLDFVLLTAAVEVAPRWRELAEKLARVSRPQMEAYEAPHRDKNGVLDHESMWKPAYDFLLTWAAREGDSYRDVLQELQLGMDRMRNPITRRWKHLTGTLVLVHSLDTLRSAAFWPVSCGDVGV